MKSSLLNMVLILTGVTLISSASVGGVYMLTKNTIDDSKKSKLTNSIGEILPKFDALDTLRMNASDGTQLDIYEAMKDGEIVGYAVKTAALGFTQDIILLAGFNDKGDIQKIAVLSHAETPGLGDKITDEKHEFVVQYQGKNPETFNLLVKKDGGDVDAITASTITSRAYSEAIQKAYDAVMQLKTNKK